MKSIYLALVMGFAALSGGLILRVHDHPADTPDDPRPAPSPVLAPPIPPNAHIGRSTSVPVYTGRPATSAAEEKPSAFTMSVHTARPDSAPPEPVASKPVEPKPVESKPVESKPGRVHIAPDPPAVIPLERTFVASRLAEVTPAPAATPAPAPSPAPVQEAAAPKSTPKSLDLPAATPETNHATLRAGMLISVRIDQALSSNLNSPGDVFSGTLDRPLIADGFVIAERGARVRGEVVESKSNTAAPQLSLRLREILASDGQRVHLVSDPWTKAGVYQRFDTNTRQQNPYDTPLTRGGAAVVRPATAVTFRLQESVELSEKR